MKSALTALLTICLCWGVGCSKNLSEFQETKARAILGDSMAQTRLALMYYYGLGVKKDFTKAAKWYRKSADLIRDGKLRSTILGICMQMALEWSRISRKRCSGTRKLPIKD